MSSWTTPAQLREQDSGALLRARLGEEPDFPLALKLKKPGSADLAARFEAVRQWIRQLQDGEGPYRLAWKEINHRQLGRSQIPDGASIDNLDTALGWLGKRREAERFASLADASLSRFPELHPWRLRHPLRALEQAGHWHKVLLVLAWFQTHPRSGLYLRQLDIGSVDTKFIEQRRGLLGELLDRVLPGADLDTEARGVRVFDRRYGLRAHLPHAHSLLMDRATLLEHHGLWGEELADKRCTADLQRLTVAERPLYQELRDDLLAHPDGRPASRVRLEQEHIRFGWLKRRLAAL
ncbi:DUF3322 domain-containing protein [Stutzerimonas kirkiae]|uniref:DUF3322 domain-containing protein n=1 Tax=Stutzerimonas kirkiae TaxID=2211392 RepID=UPI0010385A9D|nr:DUF3322 domain-containing protein [Stutzerimonas kirkiae]TBV05831.1 hypothetical protein DNK08_15105 [Stutzerimonas kirkiae]